MERAQIAALVRRARTGDRRAMSHLLETAYSSVIFQCRKIMKHPEDAEDMAQEVVLTIYQNLDKLQDPEKFLSWANRIAAHMCLNQKQRHPKDLQFLEDEQGHSFLDTIEDADRQHVPDAALDHEETKKLVTDLIDALPEAQRTAVYLYYYSEMSVREIAALTGVSENTVKSRLNYARKALKDGFLGYEKDGIKLYTLSPLPFLLLLLRGAAQSQADPATAAAAVRTILSSGAAAGTGAAASASGTMAGTAAGSAGSAAGTTVATTSAATAAGRGLLGSIATKVAVSVLVGVVTVGGVTAVVSTLSNGEVTPPTQGSVNPPGASDGANDMYIPIPEISDIVMPWDEGGLPDCTPHRTEIDTGRNNIQMSIETPVFDSQAEGYQAINAFWEEAHREYVEDEHYTILGQLILRGGGYAHTTYEVGEQTEDRVVIRLIGHIKAGDDVSDSVTEYVFDARTGELLDS